MTEKEIYDAIKNSYNISSHEHLFTQNIFGETVARRGREVLVENGMVQVIQTADEVDDLLESIMPTNDNFLNTQKTINTATLPKKDGKTITGITTEKLAWFRENGMLLEPRYDPLAVAGDLKEAKEDVKNYSILGYWSTDKEGKNIVTKASLGTIIYFHIKTSNIEEETQISLKLFEDDGAISKNDEQFPTQIQDKSTKKKSISDLEIIVKFKLDNKGKAIIKLKLEESWTSMIEDDIGLEIELYWVAYEQKHFFLGERLHSTLDVKYSKKHLFLKPAYQNYSLPEMLTEQGENIIFSIGDFANEELKKQLLEAVGESLDKYRYFLGARILKSGKVVTNIGEVYLRKKAIYTYDIHTNSGKEIKLMQASTFGFKNKYVNNGKLVTTKGISQIDYFTNVGLKNNILKAGKELTDIWDIFDLGKVFFSNDFTDIPTGYLANPVSFAFALFNEAVIKPTIQGIKDDWNRGLEEDFEIIHKPKGLQSCKAFIDNTNIETPFDYLDICTPTLQKLLKNEFLSIKDADSYNKEVQKSGNISTNKIIHTIFFTSEKNKYGLNNDVYINCIFINGRLLNN